MFGLNGSKASIVEAACCPKRRNSYPKADVDGHHKKRVVRCCSRSEEVPVLGHEDSRFVHFDPVVADPDDFLLRPDREELDQNSPSIVCLTLPLATMLTVMVTALTLHW